MQELLAKLRELQQRQQQLSAAKAELEAELKEARAAADRYRTQLREKEERFASDMASAVERAESAESDRDRLLSQLRVVGTTGEADVVRKDEPGGIATPLREEESTTPLDTETARE